VGLTYYCLFCFGIYETIWRVLRLHH